MQVARPPSASDFVFYVGFTQRCLEQEDLRWLTARGAAEFDDNGDVVPGTEHKKNRPALLWADKSNIKMDEARKILEFRSFVVYTNAIKANATRIEDLLQTRSQGLPFGAPQLVESTVSRSHSSPHRPPPRSWHNSAMPLPAP